MFRPKKVEGPAHQVDASTRQTLASLAQAATSAGATTAARQTINGFRTRHGGGLPTDKLERMATKLEAMAAKSGASANLVSTCERLFPELVRPLYTLREQAHRTSRTADAIVAGAKAQAGRIVKEAELEAAEKALQVFDARKARVDVYVTQATERADGIVQAAKDEAAAMRLDAVHAKDGLQQEAEQLINRAKIEAEQILEGAQQEKNAAEGALRETQQELARLQSRHATLSEAVEALEDKAGVKKPVVYFTAGRGGARFPIEREDLESLTSGWFGMMARKNSQEDRAEADIDVPGVTEHELACIIDMVTTGQSARLRSGDHAAVAAAAEKLSLIEVSDALRDNLQPGRLAGDGLEIQLLQTLESELSGDPVAVKLYRSLQATILAGAAGVSAAVPVADVMTGHIGILASFHGYMPLTQAVVCNDHDKLAKETSRASSVLTALQLWGKMQGVSGINLRLNWRQCDYMAGHVRCDKELNGHGVLDFEREA